MINSFIARKDLESEFTVVRNEFESGENNPGSVLYKRMLHAVFHWHNYGNATIGEKAVGAICWFAFDNPAMSARFPIFAGTTELPPSFEICAQHRFRLDSAAWAFRRANRLATLKWGLTGKTIAETIAEFEDKAFADLPMLEKKVQEILVSQTPAKEPFTVERYLPKYTNDMARAAVQKYLELGDRFWMLIAMSL